MVYKLLIASLAILLGCCCFAYAGEWVDPYAPSLKAIGEIALVTTLGLGAIHIYNIRALLFRNPREN